MQSAAKGAKGLDILGVLGLYLADLVSLGNHDMCDAGGTD